MAPQLFELSEESLSLGEQKLVIDDHEFRVWKSDVNAESKELGKPRRVRPDQLERLVAALDLLQVWDWKRNYQPVQCQLSTFDGFRWSVRAELAEHACRAGGINAFPAYASPTNSALGLERYLLVIAAIREIFQAKTFRSLVES